MAVVDEVFTVYWVVSPRPALQRDVVDVVLREAAWMGAAGLVGEVGQIEERGVDWCGGADYNVARSTYMREVDCRACGREKTSAATSCTTTLRPTAHGDLNTNGGVELADRRSGDDLVDGKWRPEESRQVELHGQENAVACDGGTEYGAIGAQDVGGGRGCSGSYRY